MPITWRATGKWVEIVFSDPYTQPESERIMRDVFADPRVTRPLRFLVDVRDSAPPDSEFVGNAITFWQAHIDQMWGAKVAVVTATEGQVRMGRLSESTAESRELPFAIRSFSESEMAEAVRWLA